MPSRQINEFFTEKETEKCELVSRPAELQDNQKKIEAIKAEGGTVPEKVVYKGSVYKFYDPSEEVAKGHPNKSKLLNKKLNESELTNLMYQIGVTIMPPRETEDSRYSETAILNG